MIPRGDSRKGLMKNFFNDNVGLIISKQFSGGQHFVVNITNTLTEITSQPFVFTEKMVLKSSENMTLFSEKTYKQTYS
jgi:hypothetical protein